MSYCAEYCIEMPDDFPVEVFTRFMASARDVLLNPEVSPAWQEFAGATNLIGWRFRHSSENWKAYKDSSDRFGDQADHEELFQRECALFGMFSAGVSCIESATYALAALSSHPAVLALPFGVKEQRGCNPRVLSLWLMDRSKAQALVDTLSKLLSSTEWSLWLDLRNRMSHRSNLPRIAIGSMGAPPPATKPFNFAATSSTPRVEADIADFD